MSKYVSFLQDGDVNAVYLKVKLNLFKRWRPKVCKEKESNMSLRKR